MWSLLIYLNCYQKIFPFFFNKNKNEWKQRKFWRQKNKKSYFYKNKKVARIDDSDVNKILGSREEPHGIKYLFKDFIRYNDNDVMKPLCIKLSQMTGYVRKFEGNTTTSFKISNKQLLKKYSQIRKKVKSFLNIKFNSEPLYGYSDKHFRKNANMNQKK